ncbi:MAG: MBL fold metallo-hydrolase [Clostridiales bacterium]|nr:MBL fold metallo-hydrolase [Clostridiales bacterium]
MKKLNKIAKNFLCLTLAATLGASFAACDFGGVDSVLNSAISDANSSLDDVLSDMSSMPGETSSKTESSSDVESDLESSENSSESVESSSEESSSEENSSSGGVEEEENKISPLDVHFLHVGNATSGDCTLIKSGNTEILIDAGSTTGSIGTIVPYIKSYCTDGILEYVIATHAHQDHIAGFTNSSSQGKGIFESFECKTIIDFPKTTVTSKLYGEYVSLRDAEVKAGAKHYTALECWNNANGAQRSFTIADGITLNILYQKYYESSTSNENNNSVCTLITQGENNYLFTGDLESGGEKSLVQSNKLPKCKLFKAGHHGSNTSNTTELLSVIQPEVVVANCCCGDKFGFPHQEFIDNVAPYTDKVYIPSMSSSSGFVLLNGNIVVSSTDGKTVRVNCSNNNTLFKDTKWFEENRKFPSYWA